MENQIAEPAPSLATGHALDAATWADFVQRLRHDCNGAGVKEHGTAAALFTVQTKRIDYGFDIDYAEGRVVCHEDRSWLSPKEYWDDLDEDEQVELNDRIMADHECEFLDLDEDDQWDILGEFEDHTVTGWNKRWEIVNSHFSVSTKSRTTRWSISANNFGLAPRSLSLFTPPASPRKTSCSRIKA